MDLFDLVAKITLDSSGYERGLRDAEGKTSGFGDRLKSGFATVGKLAGGAAIAGIAAVGTAAIKVGKQSLEAYADFEQLVGGVETLFKGSAGLVEQYAANAYKTAGLSANQYMETVTSFSASLLQSLGGDTEKAAKIGDMAITDMSDNANKMGSSMESIQMAYQGFAKQNYTMLDNLKLGYGGTKTEMERLLKDATAISGVKYDISSLSDVYEAIHVIQGELEITGTTAKEASTTISGSVDSMKSAWQNLLTGIADDNADFETLVSNFVDSVVTVGSNIIPRVKTIMGGLSKLISEAANKLVPLVVNTIVENLPQIIESGVNLVVSLISGLIAAIPQLVRSIPDIIRAIINGFVSAWPQLKQAGIDLLQMVGNGIKSMFSAVVGWGKNIVQSVKNGVVGAVSSLADAGMNLVRGIWNGISNGLGWIKGKIQGWVGNVTSFIKNLFGIHSPSTVMRDEVGLFLAKGIGVGFEQGMKDVEKSMRDSMPDLTSGYDFNVTGNYSAYGENPYNGAQSQGVAIYGDVHISIDGTGQNAEQIGREFYKQLVGLGVAAYAI